MIKPKIKFVDVRCPDAFDIEWWNKHGFLGNWCVVDRIHALVLLEFHNWLAVVIKHD